MKNIGVFLSLFLIGIITIGLLGTNSAFGASTTVSETDYVTVSVASSLPGCEKTNSCFLPAEVIIDVGGVVHWTNDDTTAHTIISGDLITGSHNAGSDFDSSIVIVGDSFEATFDTTGTYPYFCMFHPWMTGSVIVKETTDIVKETTDIVKETTDIVIPIWLREVVGFWCGDEIEDRSFIKAVQYLINNDVIIVPSTVSVYGGSQEVPTWIKNSACWWSQGLISDKDFTLGLQYLVELGIIRV